MGDFLGWRVLSSMVSPSKNKVMKQIITTALTGLSFVALLSLSSCTREELPKEVIADDATFKNFNSWKLEANNQGPSPSLGAAHAGNDSTVSRKVFFKDRKSRVDGAYPIGTVVVKHSTNPAGTVNEITAMVKRGNNFNPTAGNWEWFMLNADGTIAKDSSGMPMRGGALMMGGMCNSCHAGASSKDFTFSK